MYNYMYCVGIIMLCVSVAGESIVQVTHTLHYPACWSE